MEEQVFLWLDAHCLTQEEIKDTDYLLDMVYNLEEEIGEIPTGCEGIVAKYQEQRLKK